MASLRETSKEVGKSSNRAATPRDWAEQPNPKYKDEPRETGPQEGRAAMELGSQALGTGVGAAGVRSLYVT